MMVVMDTTTAAEPGAPAPREATGRPSAARQRILDTAFRLFYARGIRAVGVDTIIAESGVAKATFYKHYRAKDNLIVEYVTARHLAVRENLTGVIAGSSGAVPALRTIVSSIANEIGRQGFRGCPFINAAAEFPDPTHAVRQIVTGSVLAATTISFGNGLTVHLQSVNFSFAGLNGLTDLDASASGFHYANLAAGTYQCSPAAR